ncbi:MAG: glycoside hydrolase family 3 protein [Clostridia bacterium]|nr:glycoside hydrolase family 3 protein [Clostridia bacterium]
MLDLKSKPFYLNDSDINWVNTTLNSMTEEEKIAQLFCLITYTDDENYLKYLAGILKVGGVMTRTMSLDELCNTVTRLQTNAKIPMLISANLEAGLNQACYTGTRVGCEMGIAATNDAHYATELGSIIGEEASALGINWSFAPIIDIDYNFRNPITNTRTFGSNPKTVAEFGKAYVEEVQKYGIAASIKHFPGDGVDERDQHLLASVNTMSTDEWDKTYGVAYKTSIDAGAKTVMVGHIMQPAYSKLLNPTLKDEDVLPGLIAKELLNGLLREKLGFDGLIVTDSSTMAGIGTVMPREKAVPLTIAAGCDMFLFTKNLEEDMAFMTAGVKNGVITKERLDEAVTRILALKASLKLHEKSNIPNKEKAMEIVGCAEHRKIEREVADNSITLVKEEKGVLPISKEKYKRVLVYKKEGGKSAFGGGAAQGACDSFVEKLKNNGFDVTVFVPDGGWEGMAKPVKEMTDNYDLIIYLVSMATKSNQTIVRIEWAEPMGADVPVYMHTIPTIAISLENPYHLIDMPRVKTYINTYGGTDAILDSLLDKLLGKSEFTGVSPVDAFCGKWDTRL